MWHQPPLLRPEAEVSATYPGSAVRQTRTGGCGAARGTNATNRLVGVAVDKLGCESHHRPPGLGIALILVDVPLQLCSGEVAVALVLDRDPQLRIGQLAAPEEAAERVVDVEIQMRLGQSGSPENEADLRLGRR